MFKKCWVERHHRKIYRLKARAVGVLPFGVYIFGTNGSMLYFIYTDKLSLSNVTFKSPDGD